MFRRILLILVIAGVVAGLVFGIRAYLKRRSGPELLKRAELDIKAGEFQRAASQAREYVAQRPGDWRGHYVLAKAYTSLGRYADARGPLAKAAELKPDEVQVQILLAETYSLPARLSLTAPDARSQASVLTSAAEGLIKANEILDTVDAKDDHDKLDVRQGRGMNLVAIGTANRWLAKQLLEEARLAASGANTVLARAKTDKANRASELAAKARRQAKTDLLEVVVKDGSRDRAGRALVRLCIDAADEKSFAAAKKSIMALDDPPPVPAMMIALHELRLAEKALPFDRRRDRKIQTCRLLDQLLERHPRESQVRLTRGELALELSDFATAERLCKELLKQDSPPRRAGLLYARLLMKQGQFAEAEKRLIGLKTSFPNWAEAHFAYAQAAHAMGKREPAKMAMRVVTRLVPEHAQARRYMARSLLDEGHLEQALIEARAYYQAHPDDPQALSLFVRASAYMGQVDPATKALTKALTDHASRPQMLMVVAEGYAVLGMGEESLRAAKLAAAAKPATPAEGLAVARALVAIGRAPEAESMLHADLVKRPNDPALHAALGQLYYTTGRALQAIDQYQAALALDKRNPDYRLALARTLFANGSFDECEEALQQIDRANAAAQLLSLQLKLLQGKATSPEQILDQLSISGRGGMALALSYFHRGQYKHCINVCMLELKRDPRREDLRSLLGQAHLRLGQTDEAVGQYDQLVTNSPDRLVNYLRLAAALARESSPAEVTSHIKAVAKARPELVETAVAWLLERAGSYKQSAGLFATIAGNEGYPAHSRDRARLLGAGALGLAGRADEAIRELDRIGPESAFSKRARFGKARLLAAGGKLDKADPVVQALRKEAVRAKDGAMLRRIARFYLEMKKPGRSLAACDDLQAAFPADARSYLTRALVLSQAGRRPEAIEYYRRALSFQPGNFNIYQRLIAALEAEQKHAQALEALAGLMGLGRAGKAHALYQRGLMLARWGLEAQAVKDLQQLSKSGYADNAGVRLALAHAFAEMGHVPRAREILKKIPVYASQYVAGRLLLAELAETPDDKLAVLDELGKAKPELNDVVARKLAILLDAGRGAQAVKVFKAFAARKGPGRVLPGRVAFLGLRAMLRTGDRKSAAKLAAQVYKQTRRNSWLKLAVLLAPAEGSPAAPKLPPVAKADRSLAMLGLAAAVDTAKTDEVTKWHARVRQTLAALAGSPGQRTRARAYAILADLAAGKADQAQAAVKDLRGTRYVLPSTAAQLIASVRGGSVRRRDVAVLLRASVALDMGVPELAGFHAMELLKRKPTCRWAASLALRAGTDEPTERQVLKLLRPTDCALAHVLRARLAVRADQQAKAADAYALAAAADGGNLALLRNQAVALHGAGRHDQAIKLYRQAWAGSRDPVAANNLAYLLSKLHAGDPKLLTEASACAAAAVKAAPNMAPFRDTKGWIAHLQRRDDRALPELRRAVTGQPRSVEVHYHLGVVEAAGGDKRLARWHLAAVGNLAEKLKARGKKLTADQAEYARLARQALTKLGA